MQQNLIKYNAIRITWTKETYLQQEKIYDDILHDTNDFL